MLRGSNQRMHVGWVMSMLLSGSAWACGANQDRPPFASESSAEPTDDPSLLQGTGAQTSAGSQPLLEGPQTTATPSGCGETTVTLDVVRPNFYFVLDASASMLEPIPGLSSTNRHLAARTAIANMLRLVGHRVNYGAATFPGVDGDGCGGGTETFPTSPGDEFDLGRQEDGPTLRSLLFNLRQRSPAGATPITATLDALQPVVRELDGPTTLFLVTDGAPNCGQSSSCAASECIPNIEQASFSGGPNCNATFNCCRGDFSYLCLDAAGPVAQLTELAENDISTYVIGIPGSETFAQVLDEMARAGGRPRSDAERLYYAVEDAEQLAATLAGLGEELAIDCRIRLSQPSKNAAALTVRADGQLLEVGSDWTFVDGSTIELTGDRCSAWRSAEIRSIEVVTSCPVTEIR